jgi:hypothetical protein
MNGFPSLYDDKVKRRDLGCRERGVKESGLPVAAGLESSRRKRPYRGEARD